MSGGCNTKVNLCKTSIDPLISGLHVQRYAARYPSQLAFKLSCVADGQDSRANYCAVCALTAGRRSG